MSTRPTLTASAGARHSLDLTPAEFVEHVLHRPLYPWQREMLTAFDQPGRYSLRCCNEAGKTTNVLAGFASWFLTAYALGTLVCTAGVYRQVTDQLFPSIRRLASKMAGWDVKESTLSNGRGGFGRGFRAVDPDFLEGYHSQGPDAPLAMIVDEGKSVSDDIFTGIERCRPDWLILASSPGEASGEFYKSQTSQRRFWKTFPPVTAQMCPHISPATIETQIEKWGINHWLVRSMIFAEFTRQSEAGAVVVLADVERALHQPPPYRPGASKRGACDFAAGGDENVFAVREGNRVSVRAAWRERDTMSARDAFIMQFEAAGFDKETAGETISGDADGLGGPVCDALAEKGWHIARFHGGQPAYNATQFSNRTSELWNEFGADCRRGEWIIEDRTGDGGETLLGQLSARKGRRDGKGRLALESKEDLKKRGVDSPDRADAVIMAACDTPAPFFIIGGGNE